MRARVIVATGAAAGAIVVGLFAGLAPDAAAASTASTPVARSAADASGQMMLVLDASGSMAEPARSGQTKIAAAKQALGTVIDDLPGDQRVGLRVYGAKVESRDQPGACTDSQQVVDLGTDNRAELRHAVAAYRPFGETPIGYALEQAGKDLGGEGQRTIVLVSDGEPTCAPDPCVVAKQLSRNGLDLKIDVVGLDVRGKARDKLRCIAEKGHGTYYDADDAASLADRLTVSSTRAFRPFDLTGTAVKGTPEVADAPTIETGQYLDTIPLNGALHYRVERTAPGSTFHVGVTFKGAAGSAGDGARVAISAGGDECNYGAAFDNGVGTREPLITGSTMSWRSEVDSACNTADELVVEVKPDDGSREALANRPIELVVYEEPPLADPKATDLPPAPDSPEWTTLRPGPPITDVVAGTSMSNAPLIHDGTYAGDLNPGESQVYAVPVDWGQNVQAQLDSTVTAAVHRAAAVGSDIEVHFIGPIREDAEVDFSGAAPGDWETGALANIDAGTRFRTGAQTQTISYLNRSSTANTGAALAGVRYVQVTYNVRGNAASLPYRLTVKTNGTAGQAAPAYADVDGLTAPRADSRLVQPVASDSGAAIGASAPARSDGSEGSDGGLPWLVIGLVAVAALVVGAGGVLLGRRSTRGGR